MSQGKSPPDEREFVPPWLEPWTTPVPTGGGPAVFTAPAPDVLTAVGAALPPDVPDVGASPPAGAVLVFVVGVAVAFWACCDADCEASAIRTPAPAWRSCPPETHVPDIMKASRATSITR